MAEERKISGIPKTKNIKELITAKFAKKCRKERGENHTRKPSLIVLQRPFLASFADVLRDLRGYVLLPVTDISVLFPENEGTKDFAHEKKTKAPEGTATGATTGAIVGGGLGWLVGIGALAIPGLGPFVAAGPIMAALAGVGAGGAIGGIAGALIGMGIPEYEAKRYEGRVKDGGILLSVHCDDSKWTKRAKEILQHTGADDISSTGEASADFAKTDRPMPRNAA